MTRSGDEHDSNIHLPLGQQAQGYRGMTMQVNESLCVGCGQCVLVCEAGAISCQWGRIQIDDSLCISCGVCMESCPVDALAEETK